MYFFGSCKAANTISRHSLCLLVDTHHAYCRGDYNFLRITGQMSDLVSQSSFINGHEIFTKETGFSIFG